MNTPVEIIRRYYREIVCNFCRKALKLAYHPIHLEVRHENDDTANKVTAIGAPAMQINDVAHRLLNKSDETRRWLEFAGRKRRSPSRLPSFSNISRRTARARIDAALRMRTYAQANEFMSAKRRR